MDKYLVIQVAALGHDFLHQEQWSDIGSLPIQSTTPVFPALTCSFQATMRTAMDVAEHGMIANGRYSRTLSKPAFWEQSAGLVEGERIWKPFRERGKTVALLFWQQSLGESVDMVLSPAPIHKHHGGMIMDCYAQPVDLYSSLCAELHRPFPLKDYWGPLASPKSGQWIAEATCSVLSKGALAPDLCFTYLPTLDYALQRKGPASKQAKQALIALRGQLEHILQTASEQGYQVLVVGDYAIGASSKPLFPNRVLLDAGLMRVREVRGMLYPDF